MLLYPIKSPCIFKYYPLNFLRTFVSKFLEFGKYVWDIEWFVFLATTERFGGEKRRVGLEGDVPKWKFASNFLEILRFLKRKRSSEPKEYLWVLLQNFLREVPVSRVAVKDVVMGVFLFQNLKNFRITLSRVDDKWKFQHVSKLNLCSKIYFLNMLYILFAESGFLWDFCKMIVIKSCFSDSDDMLFIFLIDIFEFCNLQLYLSLQERIKRGVWYITRMKSNGSFESWVFFCKFYRLQTCLYITSYWNTHIFWMVSKKMLQNIFWRFFKRNIGVCVAIKEHINSEFKNYWGDISLHHYRWSLLVWC